MSIFQRTAFASLMPTDPGLLRFTAAVRINLATFLSCCVVIPILLHFGQPVIEASPPMLFVMMSTLFARDATLRRRQVTVLQSFLGAAVAFVCAANLEPWPLLGVPGMIALLGIATLLHTRGTRTFTVWITIVICYYTGLLLHPPLLSQAVIVALMIPPLLIALAMLELFPDDPELIAHLMLASVAAQADRVAAEARHPRRDPRRLERHLMQLNRAIAATEAQLALGELFGQEATIAALAKLEVAVTHAVLQVRGAAQDTSPEWRRILAELIRAAAGMRRRHAADLALATPASAPPLAWRSALRVTCAAVVAACIGYPFSPQHWYWAMITVFVISIGTSSAGDTLQKGMLRLAGTATGAFAGLCVATLVPAHSSLTLAGMALCVIGWSYFVLYEYAIGVFFLTLLIGLVYGEFGQNIPDIVGQRLLETVIGAAAACAAALWLIPLRTSEHVRGRALALIARLSDVVDSSHAALTATNKAGDAPLAAMRRLDQALHDLRLALLPLRARRRLWSALPPQDKLSSVMVCVHWARVLAVAAATGPTLPQADRDALLARLAQLRTHLADVTVTPSGLADGPLNQSGDPSVKPEFNSGSADVIAEAADRIDDALSGLLGRATAKPQEFAQALLA